METTPRAATAATARTTATGRTARTARTTASASTARTTSSARSPRISYTVEGAGPAVILVHGWCCDRSFLDPQREYLRHGHTVVALDLRGHGESEAAAGDAYAIGDFADDVAAVVAETGLESPVVIGHSMGALVALECAARGLAGGVVLLDSAPLLDERGKSYFRRSAEVVAEDHDGAWRRAFVDRLFLPTDRVRRDDVRERMPRTPVIVAAAAMRGMGEYDAAEALRHTRAPVLAVAAAKGEDLHPVREVCPGLVTGQTVGAGHFHQLEVPDQVNAMIARFLDIHGLGGIGAPERGTGIRPS